GARAAPASAIARRCANGSRRKHGSHRCFHPSVDAPHPDAAQLRVAGWRGLRMGRSVMFKGFGGVLASRAPGARRWSHDSRKETDAMPHLANSDMKKILAELGKRGVNIAAITCPACGRKDWAVADEIHVMSVIEMNTTPPH